MKGTERKQKILEYLKKSAVPVSGGSLSEMFGVSRQIIVSDISALKSDGNDIISTNKGYFLNKKEVIRDVKVVHTDTEIEEELNSIVELGAEIKNVFVWHKIYGKIEAELNITSKRDVAEFMKTLKTGRSSPLKKITSDYHYHTLSAENENVLNNVEKMLKDKGYLVSEIG